MSRHDWDDDVPEFEAFTQRRKSRPRPAAGRAFVKRRKRRLARHAAAKARAGQTR